MNKLYNQSVQEYFNGNISASRELKFKADEKKIQSYFKLEDKYNKSNLDKYKNNQ